MKVFLSYAHEDAEWADSIREALRYSKGSDQFEVWNPKLEIQPGENWAKKIGEALESSDALVVLLSPRSVNSPNVRQEIDFALTQPKFKDRLISVMVKPTSGVPWILRSLPFIDGTRSKQQAGRAVAAALTAALEKQTAKQ